MNSDRSHTTRKHAHEQPKVSSSLTSIDKLFIFASAIVGVVACGGGSGNEPGQPANNEIASISIAGGNLQTATVATELPNPLLAVLLNSAGQPVTGKSVSFVATSGSGSVFAGFAVSDVGGVVRERWTLGTKVGVQRVEVRGVDASGLARTYASFDANATAGPPKSIASLSGSSQTGAQLSQLPAPLRVRVTDEYLNPVPGLLISFVASDGGNTTPANATTDSRGEAETNWTLGNRIGQQSMVASALSTVTTSFSANATSSAPRVEKIAGDFQSVNQYSFTSQPMSVRVTLPNGSLCVSCDITFAKAATAGARTPVVPTASNGIATLPAGYSRSNFSEANVVGLYFPTRGQEQITVTASGLGSASFTVNVGQNPRIYDGLYICNAPAYGFNMIVAGSSITTIGGYTGSTGTGSLNESDGSLTGFAFTFTPNTPFGINLVGRITVGADQKALGSGTYSIDAIFGQPPGTWSCPRQ